MNRCVQAGEDPNADSLKQDVNSKNTTLLLEKGKTAQN